MNRKITFAGIDSWSRPCWKVEPEGLHPYFIGCTIKLFDFESTESEVKEWFKNGNEGEVSYFGSFFGCEPMGSELKCEVIESFKQYLNA